MTMPSLPPVICGLNGNWMVARLPSFRSMSRVIGSPGRLSFVCCSSVSKLPTGLIVYHQHSITFVKPCLQRRIARAVNLIRQAKIKRGSGSFMAVPDVLILIAQHRRYKTRWPRRRPARTERIATWRISSALKSPLAAMVAGGRPRRACPSGTGLCRAVEARQRSGL